MPSLSLDYLAFALHKRFAFPFLAMLYLALPCLAFLWVVYALPNLSFAYLALPCLAETCRALARVAFALHKRFALPCLAMLYVALPCLS